MPPAKRGDQADITASIGVGGAISTTAVRQVGTDDVRQPRRRELPQLAPPRFQFSSNRGSHSDRNDREAS